MLTDGDRVEIVTPGGGGYGNPAERDPALVKEDLAEGYVTPERAKADYGLAAEGD